MAVGASLLAVGLAPIAGGFWAGRQADQRWQQVTASAPNSESQAPVAPELLRPVDGLDFRISVPSLGYSEVVREGVGLGILALGPGHYPRTAWPGQAGTVGVAAHNVYWLRFGDLRPGDQVRLETRYGAFRYRVTGSSVVSPGDAWVLDASRAPSRGLTLTTCWPLWAGEFATRRLAIFARLEPPASG